MAAIGSIRVARSAGTRDAITAKPNSTNPTVAYVSGSADVTPKSRLLRDRDSRNAAERPTATPTAANPVPVRKDQAQHRRTLRSESDPYADFPASAARSQTPRWRTRRRFRALPPEAQRAPTRRRKTAGAPFWPRRRLAEASRRRARRLDRARAGRRAHPAQVPRDPR